LTVSGKKKIVISLVFGIFFSGVALYFAFRNIPIRELLEYLANVNYWWAIPSVIITMIAFSVRVVRWQLLLLPIKRVGFWRAFHPLMIGFALNCLLPARIGEVARPAVFAQKEKVPFFRVLATVGAERVFDLVILLLFFVAILAFVDIDPQLELPFGEYRLNKDTLEKIGASSSYVALVLILGIALVSVEKSRAIIKEIIVRLPVLFFFLGKPVRERIKEKVCGKLVEILDSFAAGFDLLKSPIKLIQCFFLSFLVWALSAVAYYVLSFGCPGINVSFLEMSAGMVIICFFISLPSVPGFWGLWEAGGVFALLVFGVPAKEAAGFTLANHAIQIIPVIIVGLISSLITGVKFLNVTHQNGKEV